MIHLQLKKNLSGADGPFTLEVDLAIAKGEFMALYGPSGAGKTSVLRMLAGFMRPDAGLIRVGNETWFQSSKGLYLPPQKRSIGMVFQAYSLFPNMSVYENLAFALPKGASTDSIRELLALIELEGLQDKRPHILSGGQKQRVALARAILRKPDILLLDEPLSALDTKMRGKLQDMLRTVHARYGMSTLLVSHDLLEVQRLASRMCLLEGGSIAYDGAPGDFHLG
ncbi:ABC transporter [Nitritalea halalkaliphila LW7]|uniref:ABC transporter n=1 Tax=Nitritalea halalkaliphila LW7 TaxID=1189621 RepID=I5BX02_9BACT|nr:ATP-binding cassette domain-containing protein [Nitritalea halalkaliphila]EIM74104.1 ABC transporter [Nitritalea halalkaliphila LW7]